MKSLLSSMAILWLAVSGASASAANRSLVDVSVVESVPANSAFMWETNGDEAVSCAGEACSLYATFADLQSHGNRAGVMKLRFPDGKIVVAECVTESDCAAAGKRVRAVYGKSQVKVFATRGKHVSAGEVFRVRGVLRPHLHVERGTVLVKTGLVTGPMSQIEVASN
jgi:hypothetical protein